MDAGELSTPFIGTAVRSPLRLESLGRALLSIVGLMSPVLELSLLTSPLKVDEERIGADQDPMAQLTPVKLLRAKPLRCHFRVGLPDLSKARRFALMAPVFALGLSLCAAAVGAVAGLGASFDLSIVPSALVSG